MRRHLVLSFVLVSLLLPAGAGALEPTQVDPALVARAEASVTVVPPGPLDQRVDPALRLSAGRLAPVRAAASRADARRLLEELPAALEQTSEGLCCVAPLIVRAVDVDAALAAIEEVGGTHTTVAGRRIVARVPVEAVERLAASPAVEYLAASRWHRLHLDRSRPEIKADQVQAGVGLSQAFTGKGVVVGVVDSGIDWTHADFKDAAGKTRLVSLWDRSGSGSPPSGFTTGREFTAAQIDAQQCTEADRNGHGTHVAGTAAGNGNLRTGGTYKGIAPEADLVFVKGANGDRGSFSSADEIEGCDYVFRKAASLGKAAVVNMSLGGHFGPHDGTTDEELALDALTGAGKVIVVSAGNEGASLVHLGYTTSGSSYATSAKTFLLPTGASTLVDSYFADPAARFGVVCLRIVGGSLEVVGTSGDLSIGQQVTKSFTLQGTKVSDLQVDATGVTSAGLREVAFLLQDAGKESLAYVFYTYGSGRLDAWVASGGQWTTDSGNGFVGGDNAMSAGIPATARKLIAVGAYVTKTSWVDSRGATQAPPSWCGQAPDINLAQLACFSSHGPARDGRTKPEIAAPGMFVVAPLTKDAVKDATVVAQGGGYLVDQGTSMASPHLAGVAALMLQASPTLTPEAVTQALQQTARKDAATTSSPDPNLWGAGKVDALAAVKAVASSGGPAFSDARTAKAGPGGSCAAPDPVSAFLATDAQVYLYFLERGAKTTERLSYTFLDPTGATHASGTWDPVASDGNYCFYTHFDLAGTAAAAKTGTWRVVVTSTLVPGVNVVDLSFTVSAVVTAPEMVLSGGKVAVSCTWRSQWTGKSGVGTPVKQLDGYGYFWFESADVPEAFVKVTDFATEAYQVYHTALSDVEYTVTFRVLRTGLTYPFRRDAGSACGKTDTTTVKK